MASEASQPQRPVHRARANGMADRLSRAPETARFIRRAAPGFIREISREYGRESRPSPFEPQLNLWQDFGVYAAWLGHSTVFLKIDGFTVLTDPVFSARVGLNMGPLTLGIKRLVEVATPLANLPPVDLILLSHAHMDHFDLPSLRSLENSNTQVVTANQTSNLLRPRRYGHVHELRWNESVRIGPALVRAFEVEHWGARLRSDVFRGYNGYVVEIAGRRILFGGDTAYTHSFKQLKTQQAIDLAIMPIGAYDPWVRVHCTPEQALEMANDAGAERILPVHHQTFKLGREGRLEPIERLLKAAGRDTERIGLRDIGEEMRF